MIAFGSWAPDAYDLNSSLAGEASGVLPGANSYHPWPQLQAFSAALGSVANGAFLGRQVGGSYTVFAGTTTKLYKFSSVTTWSDFAGATYAVPGGEYWDMDQYGQHLIATNGVDAVQFVDVDSGTAFGDLAGSPPKARIVKTVGDYLMLGRTENYPTGIEWSGLNDDTFWTHGQRSSDYQVFPDGGFVTGITSVDTGLIFQENAIRRFQQTADRSIFNFQRTEDGQGCIAPHSLVTVNATAYFVSRAGFRKAGPDTGFQSAPIGLEVVDKFFQDSINLGRMAAIWGVADPLRPRVFWLAPAAGSTSAQLSVLLCYDILANRWTHTTVMASLLFAGATPGYTLEGLDALYPSLDAMPISLDSPTLTGGAPYVAAFDSAFKMAFFNGASMPAVVQTNEFQAIPGKRTFISGYRPITDATAVTGRIAGRESPQGTVAWSVSAPATTQGMVPARMSARLHRIELSVPAGEAWTHLQGVDFADGDMTPDGQR